MTATNFDVPRLQSRERHGAPANLSAHVAARMIITVGKRSQKERVHVPLYIECNTPFCDTAEDPVFRRRLNRSPAFPEAAPNRSGAF